MLYFNIYYGLFNKTETIRQFNRYNFRFSINLKKATPLTITIQQSQPTENSIHQLFFNESGKTCKLYLNKTKKSLNIFIIY